MAWLRACSRIALWCGFGATGVAHAQDIRVQSVGPTNVPVEPGRRVMLAFRVSSGGPGDRVVVPRVDLPLGWQTLIPDSAVTVPAGQAELVLIPISVPASARAGPYIVRYSAAPPAGTAAGVNATDSVVVAVAERRQMSVTIARAPRFVGAGDSYSAVFVAQNSGNAPATARVELTGNRGINARSDVTSVRLEPGEEKTITVTVVTDGKATQKSIQRVGISARLVDDTTMASANASVEVVPRRSGNVSLRPTFPVELGLGQSDARGRVTPELRGSGAIGEARTSQVEFLFRPPAPGDFMLAQDEYALSIGSPARYLLQLGDVPHASTHLMQPFRPHAGAAGRLYLGRYILGAQAVQDRRSFGMSGERQYGGSVDLRLFSDRTSVGAAVLHRSGVNPGSILQGRGFSRLNDLNVFDWEFGAGDGPLGRGSGYFASLGGGVGLLTYTMQRESYDAAFPGIASGNTFTIANFRMPFTRYAGFTGSVGESIREPSAFNPGGEVLHRDLEAGVDINGFLGLTYRLARDTGTVLGAKSERTARALITLPIPHVRLGGHIERGYTVRDNAPGVEIPITRVGGRATVSLRGHSLGGSIERTAGKTSGGSLGLEQIVSQFFANVRVTKSNRLNVSYSTTRSAGLFANRFSSLDIGVSQRLPRGHEISWRGQAFSTQPGFADRDSRFRTQYLMPVSVPLPGGPETGSLDVALVNAATGRPIGGALVRFGGDARLTDALGRARFSGVLEGTHYLDIDHAYLGPERIVAPVLPLAVDVAAGERRAVELRVAAAAQVTGALQLFEFGRNRPLGAPDTLIDAGGQSYVRLQLVNNGDTLRTVSNGGGRFRFGDVRPGRWVLMVLPSGIPDLHRAEQDRFEIDLRPGDSRELTIRVLPVRPRVNFTVEEELKPETDVARPARTALSRSRHSFTVADGTETLMHIAGVMYNNRELWPKIWLANRRLLPRPESVRVGYRLVVPDSAPLTDAEISARNRYIADLAAPPFVKRPGLDPSWRPPVVTRFYTVGKGEGLIAIARVVYNDPSLWPKIWYANLDLLATPESLKIGQRLRVPDTAPLTPAEAAARDAYERRRRP